MKLIWVLLCALLCCGCLSESDKAAWKDALGDLRGDNQRMRNDFSGQLNADDQSLRPSH